MNIILNWYILAHDFRLIPRETRINENSKYKVHWHSHLILGLKSYHISWTYTVRIKKVINFQRSIVLKLNDLIICLWPTSKGQLILFPLVPFLHHVCRIWPSTLHCHWWWLGWKPAMKPAAVIQFSKLASGIWHCHLQWQCNVLGHVWHKWCRKGTNGNKMGCSLLIGNIQIFRPTDFRTMDLWKWITVLYAL